MVRKKLFGFLLILGVLLSLSYMVPYPSPKHSFSLNPYNAKAVTTAANYTTIDHFLEYENSTLGIRIDYPNNWTISPSDHGSNVTFWRQTGEGLKIKVNNLLQTLDLDEHIKAYINELNLSRPSPVAPHWGTMLESNQTTIANGNPAHRLVYQYPCMPDMMECRVLEIWTIKENKLINLKYETLYFLVPTINPANYTENALLI